MKDTELIKFINELLIDNRHFEVDNSENIYITIYHKNGDRIGYVGFDKTGKQISLK